jgi:hypothetical protein
MAENMSDRQAYSSDSPKRGRKTSFVPWLVFYGVAVLLTLPFIIKHLNFGGERGATACATVESQCLDAKTGILRSLPSLESKAVPGSDKMTIPCRLVGVWSARNDQAAYQASLYADGTYMGRPPGSKGNGWTIGWWGVQGNNLVWRSKGPTLADGNLDITRLVAPTDTSFVLAEKDGKFTTFESEKPLPPGSCTR